MEYEKKSNEENNKEYDNKNNSKLYKKNILFKYFI